jgi:hypothetical protein
MVTLETEIITYIFACFVGKCRGTHSPAKIVQNIQNKRFTVGPKALRSAAPRVARGRLKTGFVKHGGADFKALGQRKKFCKKGLTRQLVRVYLTCRLYNRMVT